MPQQFRIVCRGSNLSLAQADIFRKRLLDHDPEARVEVVIKETKGDTNQDRPLQEMEGKDFFTQDIQDYLLSGQADFAVHSLKDVSGENFFHGNHFAILEREDPRDVAIFNSDVPNKLSRGSKITLGTSSPRRVEMATGFLQKALPSYNGFRPVVATTPIRGNVDTRLQKLADGEYDGVILACAGLNRLLRADSAKDEVKALLKGKLLMILPLLHCPPAPGQGAIVIETTQDNRSAIDVLKILNNTDLARAVDQERKVAHRYGSGCHQKFGVVHVDTGEQSFLFAAGKDRADRDFNETLSMEGLPLKIRREPSPVDPANPLYRQQNITLITPPDLPYTNRQSQVGKKIWVSETASWFELAKEGVWVEGSLEGLGLEFVEKTIGSPLVLNSKF